MFLSLYNIVVLYDSRKNKQEIGFGIVLKRFQGWVRVKIKVVVAWCVKSRACTGVKQNRGEVPLRKSRLLFR